MTRPVFIRNGRIIDPAGKVDCLGNIILTADGTMSFERKTGRTPEDAEYQIIDASGMVVCPGFIDLHCHLRQPGYENRETIATGTLAAARGGFTTVCCMPNTNPPIDNSGVIRLVAETARNEGIIRVLPVACVTRERRGKALAPLAELSAKGVAGFSDDGSPVYDPEIMRQALRLCLENGLPVIEHCEVPELAGDGVVNKGAIADRLGLKGIPDSAEEEMVARDIRLASETGGWVHIAHASTSGTVELIRQAKAQGVRITAEVTPHHLTLTEEEVLKHGTLAKVNPPLRTRKDIDALIEGLNDGTIDIIATDHAPHAETDKPDDFVKAAFGISGFETALGSLMTLVYAGRISLENLIDKLTRQPALILGDRPGISGALDEGLPADLVIFDPGRKWKVDPRDFASKGKNTPLAGTVLTGKVMVTVSRGKIVYADNTLLVDR